jgi:hypothetical protein
MEHTNNFIDIDDYNRIDDKLSHYREIRDFNESQAELWRIEMNRNTNV